jgi:hypothetical protein
MMRRLVDEYEAARTERDARAEAANTASAARGQEPR